MTELNINYDVLAAAILRLGASGEMKSVASGVVSGRDVVQKSVDVLDGGCVKAGVQGGAESNGGEPVVVLEKGYAGGEVQGGAEFSNGEFVSCDESMEVDADRSGSESSVVSGGVPGAVSAAAKAAVKFGGLADLCAVEEQQTMEKKGYFAQTVRSESTKALRQWLKEFCGVVIPKRACIDLSLCTYTAGTMPDVIVDGKSRLRSLALIGDAGLTMMLAVVARERGKSVESAQSLRTKLTSNPRLAKLFFTSGLSKFVCYAPGMDPEAAVASATALEAIIGVFVLYREPRDVREFLARLGLLEW